MLAAIFYGYVTSILSFAAYLAFRTDSFYNRTKLRLIMFSILCGIIWPISLPVSLIMYWKANKD